MNMMAIDDDVGAELSMEDETRLLVAEFCNEFGGQVADLARLLERADQAGEAYLGLLQELHGEFHRLSGSSSCMGFPAVGNSLSDMEIFIESFATSAAKQHLDVLRETSLKLERMARMRASIVPHKSEILELEFEDAAPKQKITAVPSTPAELSMTNLRVLFADDDRVIRTLMRSILQGINVEAVETVASGQELLDRLYAFRPNLIITDWQMKPINGLELMQKIRSGETPLNADCPVIFLSSRNSLESVQKAMGSGASYFLVKPFSRGTVEKTLSKVMGRQRVPGQSVPAR